MREIYYAKELPMRISRRKNIDSLRSMACPERPPQLLHIFPSFAVGGQQVRFASIANYLGARYHHSVLSLNGDLSARELLSSDIQAVAAPCAKSSARLPSLFRIHDFAMTIRAYRPDILLTYNWGAVEWALAGRLVENLQHLHFEDGFGADESVTRQLRRRVWFRRLALGGSRSKIVVPSRQLRDVATRLWRFPRGKIAYLPNGIDCDRFARSPDPCLAERIGRDPNTLVVGTVGALRAEKNLARLLRVFSAVSEGHNARLVVVGDGPERRSLERLASDLQIGKRVVFLGHIPEPERIMGHFDVVALTSDTEQMPYAVLEAMAAGRPIVATDVGDIRDMVSEENRHLIRALGDEAGLVGSIRTLLADASLRKRIGGLNRERVRRTYDLDSMVARHEALLCECLAKRASTEDIKPR